MGLYAIEIRKDKTAASVLAVLERNGYRCFPDKEDDLARYFICADELVWKRLQQIELPPSDVVADETLIRRVFLDIAHRLPSPKQVTAFLNSDNPNKRPALIDRLLIHPKYANGAHLRFWISKSSPARFMINIGASGDEIVRLLAAHNVFKRDAGLADGPA